MQFEISDIVKTIITGHEQSSMKDGSNFYLIFLTKDVVY